MRAGITGLAVCQLKKKNGVIFPIHLAWLCWSSHFSFRCTCVHHAALAKIAGRGSEHRDLRAKPFVFCPFLHCVNVQTDE